MTETRMERSGANSTAYESCLCLIVPGCSLVHPSLQYSVTADRAASEKAEGVRGGSLWGMHQARGPIFGHRTNMYLLVTFITTRH